MSIDRIRRRLAEQPRTDSPGLKLQYYIEVYGKAPPLNLFEGFDLDSGPVPWSGPTHRELIDVVTPKEFRTPAADLSALIEWLRRRDRR